MTDRLGHRFDALERIATPDLWQGIEHRDPRQLDAGPSLTRRVLIAVLALTVAAAGLGFGYAAFRGNGASVATPQPSVIVEPARMRAVVTDRIRVAAFPGPFVIGEGSVWATTNGQEGPGSSEIVQIDPDTGDILGRTFVTSAPGWEFGNAGVAVGLGSVWVAGGVSRSDGAGGCCRAIVQRLDPSSGSVVDVLDAGPGTGADVWVDEGGVWALTSGFDGGERTVVHLDPVSGENLGEVDVPVRWSQAIFETAGSLWVYGDDVENGDAPISPDLLVRLDPIAMEVNGTVDVEGDGGCATIPGNDVIWTDIGEGYGRWDPVSGQMLGPTPDAPDCYAWSRMSDGLGGVWILDTQRPQREYVHVNAEGVVDTIVDASDDDDLAGGSHVAYDPVTQTFWFMQFKDFLVRIELRPVDGRV